MVNNIAANVLGGASELGGELETGGTLHVSYFLFAQKPNLQMPPLAILHGGLFFLLFHAIKPTWSLPPQHFFFWGGGVQLIPFCIFLTYLREAVSEISFKLCYIFIYHRTC